MPTHFNKIHVISDQAFEPNRFAEALKNLEEAARREALEDIYRILREMNIGFRTEERTPVRSTSAVIRSAAARMM